MPSILHPGKWLIKPPLGARVSTGSPFGIGMVGCFPLQKEDQGSVRNLISGVVYGPSSTAPTWEDGRFGRALDVDGAGKGIKGTAEPALRLQRVSLLWRGYIRSTPADFANFAGVAPNATDSAPYTSYVLYKDNSGKLTFGFNNGSFQNNAFRNISDFVDNGIHQFVLTVDMQPTTAGQRAYTDDASLDGSGGTTGTISYSSDAIFGIGDYVGGRDSNAVCECVYVWDRILTKQEVSSLWREPYQMFDSPRRIVKYFAFDISNTLITGVSPIASGESVPSDGAIGLVIVGSSPIASGESVPSSGDVDDGALGVDGVSPIASGETFVAGGIVAGPVTGTSPISSGESVPSSGTITLYLTGSTTIPSAESVPSSGALIGYGVSGYDTIPSAEEFPRGGLVLRDDARTLFVRGRDRNPYLAVNTMNIVEELNGRASATFELTTYGRSVYRPNPDDEVIYCYGTDRLFGGFVQTITEQAYDSRHELKIKVSCVDYRELADRRTYAKVYEGPTFDLATIVQEIFDATLAAEGITYEAAETGSVSGKRLVFDDETAATCLDRVCAVFGFNWHIDHFRRLRLQRKSFDVAPRVLRDEDGVWRAMKVTRTNRQTRTRQGVRTSVPTGGQRTTTLAGNGTHQYLLSYSLLYAPKVVVNDVVKTVVAWEDRGEAPWDFAWERTSNELRHNPEQTAYTSSDEIVVTHASSSLDVYWQEDSAAIARTAARTGGSGIIEAVSTAKNIRDKGVAEAFANSCFLRFGADIAEIEFETDTTGWHIGQWIDIFTTSPRVCGVFIVQKVQVREIGDTFLRYSVTAQARELPLVVGLEITDTSEITIEIDRPHGFESPYEGINLGGFDGEFGELINGGTYEITPIDEYSFTVDLTPIDLTGIDYEGGMGGSDGGGVNGYDGGPDPYGGYVWSGLGPDPSEPTGIGGDDALVITNVDTNTNVVTTNQAHGFTSSYPTDNGFRVAIWGVTGAVGPTGSTINHPTTRVQVLSPTTFFAADVGVLFGAGSEPFQDDRRGRCAETDAIVRSTTGSSEANAIRSMLAAGTYLDTNLDQERATFILANAIPGVASRALATGVDVTNPWYAQKDLSVVESVSVVFGSPPEGAPVKIDIKQNGTSIFAAGTYLEVPAGTTDVVRVNSFRDAPLTVERDDKFTVDVVEVGSEFPGCNGVVNLITRG